jgi:hypothetical protein
MFELLSFLKHVECLVEDGAGGWKSLRFSLGILGAGGEVSRNNSMDLSAAMAVASTAPFLFG